MLSSIPTIGWRKYVPQVLSGLVLLVCLVVTGFLWQIATHEANREQKKEFNLRVRETVDRIERRMKVYAQVLRGAQGLVAASETIDRKQFRVYVESLHIQENYPGIQGIGVSLIVPEKSRAAHIAGVRRQGYPQYTIWPEIERPTFTSIVQLEPFSGRNLRAFGYDMYSEPVRREAMDRARDTGAPSISGKVRLIQETDSDVQAGFLMYLPLYRKDLPDRIPAERRNDIFGWVCMLFRMNDLMDNLSGERADEIDVEIFDGEAISAETLMYDSNHVLRSIQSDAAHFKAFRRIQVGGHTWTLAIHSTPEMEARGHKSKARDIVAIGVLLSLLLALLTYLLAAGRARALSLAADMTRELRESEEVWRFALEGNRDGVWDWDVQTGQVRFAGRWKEMLGFAEAEIGDNVEEWRRRVHPDDMPQMLSDLDAYFGGESDSYVNEHRMLCKDGSWKWVLDRGMLVSRTRHGGPLRMVGTHTDITERKAWEQALQESEARYSALFADNTVVMLLIDPADGSIVNANAQASVFYGWDIETLKSMRVQDINVSSHEQIEAAMKRALQNKSSFFFQHRLASGEVRDVEVFSGQVAINGRELLLSSIHDVTDRKRVEEKLKLAALVFQNASEAMTVTDAEVNILAVNPAFTRLTGYTAEEVLGQNPRILKSGRHDNEFYEAMWHCIKATGRWQGEIWNRRKDGSVYPEKLSISTVFNDNGTVQRYVAMFQDISKEKEAEEMIRALSANHIEVREQEGKRIAREIHDDLGQRLTLLRMDVLMLPKTLGEQGTGLSEAVARMRASIDDCIKIARNIVAELRPAVLDIGIVPAIEWLLDDFESRTGIECLFHDLSDGEIVLNDQQSTGVFRILQESLTNVAKHAGATLIEVDLENADGRLRLKIADNGVGIDNDTVGRIHSYGLTGMRERAVMLGGNIHISGQFGKGTALTLDIPLFYTKLLTL